MTHMRAQLMQFKRSSCVTAEFGHLDIDEIIEVIFFVRRSWLHPEATDRESKMDRHGIFPIRFCWEFFTDENTSHPGLPAGDDASSTNADRFSIRRAGCQSGLQVHRNP